MGVGGVLDAYQEEVVDRAGSCVCIASYVRL